MSDVRMQTEASELRSICPFCDSLTQSGRTDAKFYYNTLTQLYKCFHCGEQGKDDGTLLEGLTVVDEITKKPLNVTVLASMEEQADELTGFLAERKLTNANRALLYSPEQRAIAIVVKDREGSIVGIKYRKLDPNATPRYLSETGSVNEGFWLEGKDDTKVLIVEGEIDALTAAEQGFTGFILACQTNRVSASQINAIKRFKNVFVMPDNDLGGEQLESSTKELLGALNPIVVRVPNDIAKDLNEYLQKRGSDECNQFITMETRTAVERDTRGLSESIPELITWLSDDRHTIGDSTGWISIDSLFGGGLRAGEMSVINAFAKAGKSSFINNLIHNLAKSGKKVALASFEMPPHVVYTSLISIALNTNIRELSNEDRKDLLTEYLNDFEYLQNITMLQRFGYTPWADIEEWATGLKKTKDIDYLVLDHVGFLVEKMTDAEENQVLAKNIKKLTNTLGIHIPVVVQAPKTKDGLSIQTSYGGMAWAQNADNFLILERDKQDETLLKVRLEAARYPGSNPSYTPMNLYYKKETLTLTE